MPEIEIRSVLPADVESLSTLEHGYYSNHVWQLGMDLTDDATKAEFHRVRLPREVFVSYPRGRDEIFQDISQSEAFLMAILAGQPVGYLRVIAEPATKTTRVSDLVVSSAYRRQGIGSGLILATMDLIAHRKYFALILEMQSKNDPAIAMARKLGFNFCGFRDHYFSNGDLAVFFSRYAH